LGNPVGVADSGYTRYQFEGGLVSGKFDLFGCAHAFFYKNIDKLVVMGNQQGTVTFTVKPSSTVVEEAIFSSKVVPSDISSSTTRLLAVLAKKWLWCV